MRKPGLDRAALARMRHAEPLRCSTLRDGPAAAGEIIVCVRGTTRRVVPRTQMAIKGSRLPVLSLAWGRDRKEQHG